MERANVVGAIEHGQPADAAKLPGDKSPPSYAAAKACISRWASRRVWRKVQLHGWGSLTWFDLIGPHFTRVIYYYAAHLKAQDPAWARCHEDLRFETYQIREHMNRGGEHLYCEYGRAANGTWTVAPFNLQRRRTFLAVQQ